MKEAGILRHIKTRLDFPYWGVQSGNKKSFKGRHRDLVGYIESTRLNHTLGQGAEAISLPAGTSYLELHFCADPVSFKTNKARKVIKTMRKGAEDLLDLTDAVQKRRFQEIDLFIGTTNNRMARLAVNQLGFHYADPEILESRKKRKKTTKVTVYITKDELLSRQQRIKRIKRVLESREKRQ